MDYSVWCTEVTDQYRYDVLQKFGSKLNIKNQMIKFPTLGQNKTKCKLDLEIKGITISIVGELFLFRRWSHCCCYVELSAGLFSATDRIKVNKTCFIVW